MRSWPCDRTKLTIPLHFIHSEIYPHILRLAAFISHSHSMLYSEVKGIQHIHNPEVAIKSSGKKEAVSHDSSMLADGTVQEHVKFLSNIWVFLTTVMFAQVFIIIRDSLASFLNSGRKCRPALHLYIWSLVWTSEIILPYVVNCLINNNCNVVVFAAKSATITQTVVSCT